jgi:hypothetical protein
MQGTEEIGLAIGLVVAASLALQAALGPAMTTIVDAIKATGILPDGCAGVVSLGCGLAVGVLTGIIAWQHSGESLWLLIGAFAGLVLGAGGVKEHQSRVGALADGQETPATTTASGTPLAEDPTPVTAATVAAAVVPAQAPRGDPAPAAQVTPFPAAPVPAARTETCGQRAPSPAHGRG